MLKIYFATHNPGKVNAFRTILKGIADVEQIDDEINELQSDIPEEIVIHKAKTLCERHKKIIVAEDSGLFIKSLGGFPGTYSSHIHKMIGLQGIIKLMEGVKERECEYRSAVAICSPGKEPVSFTGSEKGKVALSIRGTHGFGHDPIFIPEGSDKTYGEMPNAEEVKKFRRIAVLKLVEWLKKQR
jgi:XTP/dITP diphosphohydrolase